ncbi:hypothetical protein BDZ89DRAFT_1046089 [Hymenopellis radicata]|nr:hypothetical protein BDZ89DRAFT_1046089 [Hymenopellis radicata]
MHSVEAQIESRRKQVEMWMEKCEAVEQSCILYSKVLGGHIKNTGRSVGELRKEKVLSHRFNLASDHQEKLRQLYHTKLEQLTTLSNRLHALIRVLGNDFFTPDILDDDLDTSVLRDVTPERFLRMEKELVRGKAQVSKRLQELRTAFVQIDWLYTELGKTPPSLDDLPSSIFSPPSFSSSSMSGSRMDPFVTSTPTPTSRNQSLIIHCEQVDYRRIFANFVAKVEEAEDERNLLVGLEHVDPTPGLLKWAADVQASLEDDKRKRETHIQAMYDELEGLWTRLGVQEVHMDEFVDAHPGLTDETVQEYELKLERMLELKRDRMSVFVENARQEIVELWDELMVSEEERQDFAPFADDTHTEELLKIHEDEIKKLKEEKRMKAPQRWQVVSPLRSRHPDCHLQRWQWDYAMHRLFKSTYDKSSCSQVVECLDDSDYEWTLLSSQLLQTSRGRLLGTTFTVPFSASLDSNPYPESRLLAHRQSVLTTATNLDNDDAGEGHGFESLDYSRPLDALDPRRRTVFGIRETSHHCAYRNPDETRLTRLDIDLNVPRCTTAPGYVGGTVVLISLKDFRPKDLHCRIVHIETRATEPSSPFAYAVLLTLINDVLHGGQRRRALVSTVRRAPPPRRRGKTTRDGHVPRPPPRTDEEKIPQRRRSTSSWERLLPGRISAQGRSVSEEVSPPHTVGEETRALEGETVGGIDVLPDRYSSYVAIACRVVQVIFEIVKSLGILITWVIDPSLVPPLPKYYSGAPRPVDSSSSPTAVTENRKKRCKAAKAWCSSIQSLKKRLRPFTRRITVGFTAISLFSSATPPVYISGFVTAVSTVRKLEGHRVTSNKTFNVAQLPASTHIIKAPTPCSPAESGKCYALVEIEAVLEGKKKTFRKKIKGSVVRRHPPTINPACIQVNLTVSKIMKTITYGGRNGRPRAALNVCPGPLYAVLHAAWAAGAAATVAAARGRSAKRLKRIVKVSFGDEVDIQHELGCLLYAGMTLASPAYMGLGSVQIMTSIREHHTASQTLTEGKGTCPRRNVSPGLQPTLNPKFDVER